MADKKNVPASRKYSPPSVVAPRPSMPALPYESGAFWGTPTTILKKDAAFTAAHAELLRQRQNQADAMAGLVHSRISLALKLSELHVLPELVAHHYEVGRQDRDHEIALQRLTHETAETNAEIELTRAQQHLASLQPANESPAPAQLPAAAAGLTPDEVDELLSNFPDLSAETRHLVALALKGRLNEKIKGQA
jgi:hypothetical protein